MAGYVESYFEQYTTPMGCGVNQPSNDEESDCALYVVVGVVFVLLAFSDKRKV